MALRRTFREVIEDVRNEARASSNTSRGIDHLEHIKRVIRRNYTMLTEEYDWKFLELRRTSPEARKVLAAGQRYYDFPVVLNPLAITQVWVKWGTQWDKVTHGIGYDQYSTYDPALSQRSDPVERWEWYGADQFEVWPTPVSNGVADGDYEIAFDGARLPEALVDEDKRLDMDDVLVTLMSAAEICQGSGMKERAQTLAGMADRRMREVKAKLGSTRPWGVGRSMRPHNPLPRHPTHIRG